MHLQTLIYKHTCKNGLKATITFELGNKEDGTYHFCGCDFKPSSTIYTLKDWEDLGELSEVIEGLNKKLRISPVAYAE